MIRIGLFKVVILSGLAAPLVAQELHIADMGNCELEAGVVLQDCRIAYRTAGQLNGERSNAVLFPTWYTGTTENLTQVVGADGYVDSSKYFVIMVDAFGNGISTSPSNSSRQSGTSFPQVSIRDMVRHQYRLLTEKFGLDSVKAVIGISMGGMQAFEWAVSYPGFADKVIPITGSPRLAVYDILGWETELDLLSLYRSCHCEEAVQAFAGLRLLVGRTPQYHSRVNSRDKLEAVQAQIEDRRLSEDQVDNRSSQLYAMVNHNVAGPYGDDMNEAAGRVRSDLLIIVSEEDHVVTPTPALEFARLVDAKVLKLTSDCGHLAVFCEAERVGNTISRFLASEQH